MKTTTHSSYILGFSNAQVVLHNQSLAEQFNPSLAGQLINSLDFFKLALLLATDSTEGEETCLLLVDQASRFLLWKKLQQAVELDSLTEQIISHGLDCRAAGAVLFQYKPGAQDDNSSDSQVVAELQLRLSMVGIKLHDYLIVSLVADSPFCDYISFRDAGLIPYSVA